MGYVAGGSSEGVGDKRPGLVFVPGLGLDAREWDGGRRCLREHGVPDDESVVLLPSLGRPAAREVALHVEALAEGWWRPLGRASAESFWSATRRVALSSLRPPCGVRRSSGWCSSGR